METLRPGEREIWGREAKPAPPGSAPHPEAPAELPGLRANVQDIRLTDGFTALWAGRGLILRSVLAFLLLGVLVLLGSQAEYRAGSTLMPEEQSDAMGSGGLGLLRQFGGLLGGVNASDLLGSERAIPVELYPEIVRSIPLQLALLDRPVHVAALDTTVALGVYLDEVHRPGFWTMLKKGVLKFPGRLKTWLTGERPLEKAGLGPGIVLLDRRQKDLLEEMEDRVQASLDKKTGVLQISVLMPEARIAAQVADEAVRQVTDYLVRYRLEKLKQDLAFTEERHAEARERFNQALHRLARFRDQNKHITSDVARTEEERLQAEYDLAFNVYNSLSNRLEEARLEVQEETPVFQVLQPVTVPLRKSEPRTLLVLFLCLLLGVAAGAALVFAGPRVARLRTTLPEGS